MSAEAGAAVQYDLPSDDNAGFLVELAPMWRGTELSIGIHRSKGVKKKNGRKNGRTVFQHYSSRLRDSRGPRRR